MDDFGDVYQAYRMLVYRFLLRLCHNEHLSEELTQEAFYQALRHADRFRGDSSMPTYLCGIAKRLYHARLRQAPTCPLTEDVPSDAPDLSDALSEADQQMTALKQLHSLPEPYREVFTLRTFCDLSHRQVGELFGKSDVWARVTYYRARQLLMDAMEREEST